MAYLSIDPTISIILLIFPFTAWILGAVTRLNEKKYVAAIIRIFFGYVIWIADIIVTILNKCDVKLLTLINS